MSKSPFFSTQKNRYTTILSFLFQALEQQSQDLAIAPPIIPLEEEGETPGAAISERNARILTHLTKNLERMIALERGQSDEPEEDNAEHEYLQTELAHLIKSLRAR